MEPIRSAGTLTAAPQRPPVKMRQPHVERLKKAWRQIGVLYHYATRFRRAADEDLGQLNIRIVGGNATPEQIGDLLFEIEQAYRASGGERLAFAPVGFSAAQADTREAGDG